jgi:hypothetical protein
MASQKGGKKFGENYSKSPNYNTWAEPTLLKVDVASKLVKGMFRNENWGLEKSDLCQFLTAITCYPLY